MKVFTAHGRLTVGVDRCHLKICEAGERIVGQNAFQRLALRAYLFEQIFTPSVGFCCPGETLLPKVCILLEWVRTVGASLQQSVGSDDQALRLRSLKKLPSVRGKKARCEK